MAKKTRAPADDMAAVEELMQDLEQRLRNLNSKAKDEATPDGDNIADFVSQTLARIAGQVRDTADEATDTLAERATEAGTEMVKRIWEEMQKRPLTTLALAAAAGYLIGLIGKPDPAE
jgi:ElaB/YqjD/DUF883 family membrane-anchored ribosome-binding protein